MDDVAIEWSAHYWQRRECQRGDRWIGMDDLTAVAPDYLGLVPEQCAYFKAETRGRWGGLCRM